MSIEIGVTKLANGIYYIRGLGTITPPTGITLKPAKGGYWYWVARRVEPVKRGESEVLFEQYFRIHDAKNAWFAYKRAVEALYNHVKYLYAGRHFMRYEPINKLRPVGKVGVSSSPVKNSTRTVIVAQMNGEVLFRESVYGDKGYREVLNKAIALREKAEGGWLKEHKMTLAAALRVIDEQRAFYEVTPDLFKAAGVTLEQRA